MNASRITSELCAALAGYPVFLFTGTNTIFEGTGKSSMGLSLSANSMKSIHGGRAARAPVSRLPSVTF